MTVKRAETELELLDQLEDRVDQAVSAVRELRMENELLKEESEKLENSVESMTATLETGKVAQEEVAELRARCVELEEKLGGVRGRIEKIVEKVRSLESET